MSCSNCYNGCPQIISDQCVRYTGIDIPALSIKNGDSLSYVEGQIITFLTSALDGTGIKPEIDKSIICNIVKKYLPTCGDLTVVDFIKALIKAVCELKPLVDENTTDITTINNFIDELEAAYDVDCLNDIDENAVTPTSGTHDVLQAVIDRLCAFITDVGFTYVKIENLEELVQDYLDTLPSATKYYTRMVPYTVVPYYGPITGFSGTGIGSGVWEKIYLCNGQNGTPDMRGRMPIGATTTPGTLPMDINVDPGGFNPAYSLNTKVGANSITLTEGQMPEHTHIATSTVIEPNSGQGHRHDFVGVDTVNTAGGSTSTRRCGDFTKQTAYATTGITVDTENDPTGNNEAHSNVQPGIGLYYIMYIP